MKYRINQIRVGLDYTEKTVQKKVLQITKLQESDIKDIKIIRRSLDARHSPIYILTVQLRTDAKLGECRDIQLIKHVANKTESLKINNYSGKKPVIVGAGPAGLMAALVLAENGVAPIVIERGSATKERAHEITTYLKTGELNTESNILYGEGGAGLFSDGKLTARSKDKATTKYFFEKLIEAGADKNILIDAEPHIGSDVLLKIIPKIREKIIELGGEFHFNTKMDSLGIDSENIFHVKTSKEMIETSTCVLATGHSARDTYKYLSTNGINLAPKPFAIGIRAELPQSYVNTAQYGKFADDERLGAASFRLTRKEEGKFRACYSFCMCPGGEVMPCASSEGMMTTNGMSWSKRAGQKANAAFLVPVNESDYINYKDENYPSLEGIFFQESIEKKIFEAGDKSYLIPASKLSDFMHDRPSRTLPEDSSCKRVKITKINGILPKFVEETLIHTIPKMMGKLGRPDFREVAIFCGETRSSSPVRIMRDHDTFESTNIKGLYPCGEGAGYSGGIVSSAIDGIKVAESILKTIKK